MTRRWVREELKKNEMAEIVLKAAGFYTENRVKVHTGLAILAGIAVILGIFFYRQSSLKIKAIENLDMGIQYLRAGVLDESVKLLQQAGEGPKEVSSMALLYESEVYVNKKEYQKAAELLVSRLDGLDKKKKPLIVYQLAKIYELSEVYDSAVQYYNTLIADYPENYLTPDSYNAVGRINEIQGRPDNAMMNYEKTVSLYPGTIYKEYAQSRIDTIRNSIQPFSQQPK